MIRYILLSLISVLLLSGSAYSQNIITFANISEEYNTADSSGFRIFKVTVSPGYKDNGYRIDVENKKGKVLYSNEVSLKLIVHKKNFKLPYSNKEEWDYETEIKSNDIINDGTLELSDCSGKRNLTCIVWVENISGNKIRLYHKGYGTYEHLLTYELDK
jgi:hypothetical protein